MPKIEVHHESAVTRSFRVEQAAQVFDVPLSDKSRIDLAVHVPPLTGKGSDWTIGAVIGASGSGKSSVGRAWLGERFIEAFDWPAGASILDGFPAELCNKQIGEMLTAVGFSSPPAWVRPYAALSNGQRFRCDLARALLTDGEVIGVDEFGGTVTQQVAEFCAASVGRAIRKGRTRVQRFVAFGARDEFVRWLEPDWVLDVSRQQLARGWLPAPRKQHPEWFGGRPRIEVEVCRGDRSAWPLFAKYHYLSAALHPAARVFVAAIGGEPVAFCATLQNVGFAGRRNVHRLVVLPDYQGLGIGLRVLGAVADVETTPAEAGSAAGLGIVTSHPGLIRALEAGRVDAWGGTWRLRRVVRMGRRQTGLAYATSNGSEGRATCSFRYFRAPGSKKNRKNPGGGTA